jgi:hypothetical protein
MLDALVKQGVELKRTKAMCRLPRSLLLQLYQKKFSTTTGAIARVSAPRCIIPRGARWILAEIEFKMPSC